MKKLTLTLILIAAFALPAAAQDTATPQPTVEGPSNAVTAFFVACADQAVINLTGEMLAGYDVYYQVFNAAGGQGTPLTNLRQVPVDGTFAVSDQVAYNSGATLPASIGSARVVVAREGDSTNVDFEFTVDDVQDGCASPQNALVGSTDTGAGGGGAGTTTTGQYGIDRSILAPNGALLNPNLEPEPAVVVGSRPSDTFRSSQPGLVFAECDAYPLAEPGVIYDTDRVTIFWSWYAKTLEDMQQHLDNANYSVTLNTATLPTVTRSEPVRRDGNYWVFYTADVGNLRPGHYEVGYLVTWDEPITDGYAEFGPGTANPRSSGICNFDVRRNPDGTSVVYTDMYQPTNFPVHNIFTDDTVNNTPPTTP